MGVVHSNPARFPYSYLSGDALHGNDGAVVHSNLRCGLPVQGILHVVRLHIFAQSDIQHYWRWRRWPELLRWQWLLLIQIVIMQMVYELKISICPLKNIIFLRWRSTFVFIWYFDWHYYWINTSTTDRSVLISMYV